MSRSLVLIDPHNPTGVVAQTVGPLASSDVFATPPQDLTLKQQLAALLIVRYLESNAKTRLEGTGRKGEKNYKPEAGLRFHLLAAAQAQGENVVKNGTVTQSKRLDVPGIGEVLAVCNEGEIDAEKLSKMLAAKGIPEIAAFDYESVIDPVKVALLVSGPLALNSTPNITVEEGAITIAPAAVYSKHPVVSPSKIGLLVAAGKLKTSDVDACRGETSWMLRATPAPLFQAALEASGAGVLKSPEHTAELPPKLASKAKKAKKGE